MTAARVVVVGSGSLARAVCDSLSAVAPAPTDVTVLARSADRAAEAAFLAGTRARLGRVPATFTGSGVDFADPAALDRAVAGADAVVVCASAQSPWERVHAPSAWTDLLSEAGFGVTLPLQLRPALDVVRAAGRVAPGAVLVNACFPDAVNPLLAALDAPVTCGIGNAALVAATLQHALGLPDQGTLRVLAHHVHLHAPHDPADEARAWVGDDPVPDVTGLLTPLRAADRTALNTVTGHAGALLLVGLLTGGVGRANLPGPLGLPGGYPVTVTGRTVSLDLPRGVSPADAVAWNLLRSDADGVRVEGDRVTFGPAAEKALAPHLPALAPGFDVGDALDAHASFRTLRAALRSRPSYGPPEVRR